MEELKSHEMRGYPSRIPVYDQASKAEVSYKAGSENMPPVPSQAWPQNDLKSFLTP